MVDLVQWLTAQLDEDERIARAATAGPWSRMGQRVLDPSPPSDRLGVGMAVGHAAASADFNETADHIAAWDPARVLREIDAKRKLANLHRPVRSPQPDGITNLDCSTCGGEEKLSPSWPCPSLRLLAAPYSDRDGYREGWAP
jgi:hypothetical protein